RLMAVLKLPAQIRHQRRQLRRGRTRSEDRKIRPLEDDVAAIFVHQPGIDAIEILDDATLRLAEQRYTPSEPRPEHAAVARQRSQRIAVARDDHKAAPGDIVEPAFAAIEADVPLRKGIAGAACNVARRDEALLEPGHTKRDQRLRAARLVELGLHGGQPAVA